MSPKIFIQYLERLFRPDLLGRAFPSPHVTRLIMQSLLVGIVAGLGTLVFSRALDVSTDLCMRRICGVELPVEGSRRNISLTTSTAPEPREYRFQNPPLNKRVWILIVPAVGGLLCGLLVFTFAPETEGHGTDAVVDAFHRKDGLIRRRVPIIKMISSILTMSTGGNAGREGPIAQVSAGFGSFLAEALKLSPRRRRILVIAGVGAGIGSMFRAPMGGALFAVEVLYRETEFEYEALIPAFIASIVGYTTYASFSQAGMGAIFSIPRDLTMTDPRHLFLALMLVPVLILASAAYIKTFYGLAAFFKTKFSIRPHFRPMIGGLLLGAIAFADPRLLTTGYGWVQETIDDHMAVSVILWLAVAKIVLTGVTIGSGGSGGVFGPSMVIGGLLGGAFGTLCHQWIPSVQPAVFVLLGMAGFFSAVSKTPISTIIMVSEMTVGYALLLPLMLVSSFSYLLMPRDISIFIKQVARRMDSPAHLGDFVVDLLERISVATALSRNGRASGFIQFDENDSLKFIFDKLSASTQTSYPVINAQGILTGLVRLDDLRSAFMEPGLQNLVIARDAATTQFEPLLPTDTLKMALHKMSQSRCAELPVISAADAGRVIGLLSRSEILQAYDAQMQRTAK